MPKFTRHELFCKAFDEFISNHINIETANEETIELTPFGPIKDYKLINTTSNKSRCKQEYILTVPTQTIVYHTEPEVNENNDEESIWQDPVPVYGPHHVPTFNQFKHSFIEYFNKYRMYHNGNLMSYMIVKSLSNTYDLLSTNPINIEVIYHKNYTPFPRPLTQLEQIEIENEELKNRLSRKIKLLSTLRKQLSEEESRSLLNYNRLQRHFRTEYEKSTDIKECPVCYDIINPSTLIIPGCLHAICIDCVVKCDACPLCRDKYDHYIECDPLHPI
jgi:hypothetical protein